ncbi:MAG: hypothetical protein ACKOFW_04450, partial [Planctomycetaceae bacterium]
MTSLTRCVGVIGAIWVVGVARPAISADYRHQTPNFTVQASTPEIARQVGDAAEYFRREIARQWLGTELPKWSARCPIRVKVGQIGAGGQTTFNFHPVANGPSEVCDWNMEVQGSLERILDSVIPHEVSHTIFACYFRRPLPRWADEGAATLVECESERRRQVLTVEQVMQTRNRIPLNQLLAIKEYPRDHTAVMTLYAEGYSLAEWLVQQGGRPRFLEFLELAHQQGWPTAINRCYQLESIDALEKRWQEWVIAGSPELPGRNGAPATLVAQAEPPNATDPNGLRGEATRSAAPSASPAGRGRVTTSPARPRPDRQLATSTPSQRPNLGEPAGETARVRGQSPSEPDEPLPQRPSRDAELVAMGNRLTAPSPTRRSGTTALGEPEPLADSRAPARPSSRSTDPAPWETDADPRLDRDLGPQVAGGGAQESLANGLAKPASRPLPPRGRAQPPRDDLERGANAVAMGDEFAEPEESPPASLGALASRSNPTRLSRSSPGGNSPRARGELTGNPVAAGVAPRSVSRVTRSEFP